MTGSKDMRGDASKGAELPSSATAAGNVQSAATVANKLSEPSNCPAGRRFAAALWLGAFGLEFIAERDGLQCVLRTQPPLAAPPKTATAEWCGPRVMAR